MGRSRPQPQYLGSKLLQIRRKLALTQKGMLGLLDYRDSAISTAHLSDFESGKREPPLPLLLRYARVAYVPLEALVDDELSLPDGVQTRGVAKEGECPYCHSTEGQNKNGRSGAGSQRYICQKCRRNYTPQPLRGGYSDEVRLQVARLHAGGMKPWRIASTLGLNPQTVINWINVYQVRGAVRSKNEPQNHAAVPPETVRLD
jgi:transposase-like protein